MICPPRFKIKEDYIRYLARFLGRYERLEQSLLVFGEWEAAGFTPRLVDLSSSLSRDLTALRVEPDRISRAAHTINPDLSTSSHAVGALYVLESSALGGRFILRGLKPAVTVQVAGATTFFGGRNVKIEPTWGSFRIELDSFGRANPDLCDDVIVGAQLVFESLLMWFGPLRPARAARQRK